MNMAPTLVTTCTALPPEGAAAPAARQSRFRGPCLKGEIRGSSIGCYAPASTGARHV